MLAALAALAISSTTAAQTPMPIADAVAGPSVRSHVVSEQVLGGSLRAAIWTQPQEGFPLVGGSYAVVSPGDATLLGAPDRTTTPVADPFGAIDATGAIMTLYGLGGFELVIQLPANADKLSFSYVYFSADSYADPDDPYRALDPFRVFLLTQNTTRKAAESTVWLKPSSLGFLPQRDVILDVSSLAGQEIALQFLASNQWDRALPSGALIDGLALTLSAPASTAAVAITSPTGGDWVRGSTTFAATASATNGVASVTFTVDGGEPIAAVADPVDGSWGIDYRTTPLQDGWHTLGARVIANDGVSAEALAVRFGVDNTKPALGPALGITSPQPGDYARETLTLSAIANDGEPDLASGLESIALAVNGRSAGACVYPAPQYGRVPCSVDYDTKLLQNGEFTVTATATDAVGNSSVTSVTAIADNTSPAKFLISPRPGQVVASSVDVAVNVLDDYFLEVSCSLDRDFLFTSNERTHTMAVDLVGKIDGAHEVSCLATDHAGNDGTEAADFVVKNWTETLHPETLSLASRGGARSVTAYVEGAGVDVLLPLVDRIALAVNAEPPTILATGSALVDEDGDGVPTLVLKFDRQALIDAARHAVLTSRPPLRVGFTVDGREFGFALIAVLVK